MLALLVAPAACKTSLTARADAGREARSEDAPPDQVGEDVAPDLPGRDNALDLAAEAPVLPDAPVAVRGSFRFDNHTNQAVYVRVDTPVDCQMQTTAGPEYCNFFGWGCLFHCAAVATAQSCCVRCERPEPALYEILPGGSRTVPWAGTMFVKATDRCSECQCQQEVPVHAMVQASATVYASFWCDSLACQTDADGIIRMADPLGPSVTLPVPWRSPTADGVVVIDITALPALDASAGPEASQPDLARAADAAAEQASTGDSGADLLPAPFADLPGHDFGLSASSANPDASVEGRSCEPAGGGAVYRLSFSADGASVTIAPSIMSAKMISTGKLAEQSATRLRYDLDTYPGGELVIQPDGNGGFTANIVVFGSGVPVLWCIEAPLT